MMPVQGYRATHFPPLKGEGRRAERDGEGSNLFGQSSTATPTRQASAVDLPLLGGGKAKAASVQ
jgi:hypothetical protein